MISDLHEFYFCFYYMYVDAEKNNYNDLAGLVYKYIMYINMYIYVAAMIIFKYVLCYDYSASLLFKPGAQAGACLVGLSLLCF